MGIHRQLMLRIRGRNERQRCIARLSILTDKSRQRRMDHSRGWSECRRHERNPRSNGKMIWNRISGGRNISVVGSKAKLTVGVAFMNASSIEAAKNIVSYAPTGLAFLGYLRPWVSLVPTALAHPRLPAVAAYRRLSVGVECLQAKLTF